MSSRPPQLRRLAIALGVMLLAAGAGPSLDATFTESARLRDAGFYDRAAAVLRSAWGQADGPARLRLRRELGVVLTYSGRWLPDGASWPTAAETMKSVTRSDELGPGYALTQLSAALADALADARAAGSAAAEAVVLSDLGNLYAAAGRHADADALQTAALDVAARAGEPSVVSGVLINAASAATDAGRYDAASDLLDRALRSLPPGHPGRLRCARLALRLADKQPAQAARLAELAMETARTAEREAVTRGDVRAEAFADALLAEGAERFGAGAAALSAWRRAVGAAQRARAEDLEYRCHWGVGRALVRAGDRAGAATAYQSAVDALQAARGELGPTGLPGAIGGEVGGGGGGAVGFRQSVGDLYYEYAELLLDRAGSDPSAAETQTILRQARDTVELLKGAELESYFRDGCVAAARARRTRIDPNDTARPSAPLFERTAVLYVIPLRDRLEILVSLPGGMRRASSPLGREAFEATVRELRGRLVRTTDNRYRRPARTLYDAIIRPVRPLLEDANIDTLVFVPDGALRTVPPAALMDGTTFLIEQYAVAVTPGLDLMEPRPVAEALRAGGRRAFVGGMSEARPGFDALRFVPAELDRVSRALGETGPPRLNAAFATADVERAVAAEPYSVVHFATHGSFGETAAETFVLAYDRRLYLDDLQRMIQPSLFKGRPVELLTLSACETAAGSDRAALGLAGVAVKSGARSALATLWTVDDASSAELTAGFYEQLARPGPGVTKARALRAAQLDLLARLRAGAVLDHPYYWSPYLLIGNWL